MSKAGGNIKCTFTDFKALSHIPEINLNNILLTFNCTNSLYINNQVIILNLIAIKDNSLNEINDLAFPSSITEQQFRYNITYFITYLTPH